MAFAGSLALGLQRLGQDLDAPFRQMRELDPWPLEFLPGDFLSAESPGPCILGISNSSVRS